MKVITVNVQISKCPKQYESVRLGGEWTVDDGETPEQVMAAALEILNQFYAESQQPKQKAEPMANGKQRLTFENDKKTLEAICKKIQGGTPIETVLKYYEPDEEAMKVLNLAANI